MKIKLKFFSMAISLLFLGACSLFDSVEVGKDMPITIGEYKRNYDVISKNNWFTAQYEKPSVQIFYGLGPYPGAQQAQMQVTNKKFCNTEDSSAGGAFEVLKQEALKDKAGNELGKILICRESVKDAYRHSVGNFKYTITLSNDKNYVYLHGVNAGLKDLTDFAEMLPLNSQVDFAGLNLQAFNDASLSEIVSADELMKLDPPVKLAKEPFIKGKVLIAKQIFSNKLTSENLTGVNVFEKDVEKYGLTKDSVAGSYNQAETIIQIACSKGERIGDYTTKDAEQKKFPAYALNCKISVIDKTIPAIIARKNLVGTTLYEQETFSSSEKEIIAVPPYDEMQNFIKGLVRR